MIAVLAAVIALTIIRAMFDESVATQIRTLKISAADGIVFTAALFGYLFIPEAKKALLEVYEQRKGVTHVELTHPQTIDEISARMYEPTPELLQYQYRIEKCDDQPESTHMLTKYTLDPENGDYSQTGIICYGDYFKCNEALKAAAGAPAPPAPTPEKSTYEIYQLMETETNDGDNAADDNNDEAS